jgi:mutator protein MutT
LSPGNPRPAVHVVAAAVIDAEGRVLIAQRPAGKHLAGGWEFPGGKLEPGEERVTGLARELNEELGITIGAPRPLIRVRHAYPSREVLLDVWVVRDYRGEPRGLDEQALRWVSQEELQAVELLPADWPIVRALRLPERLTHVSSRHYAIGENHETDDRLRGVFCENLSEADAAAGSGADFIVLSAALSAGGLKALCQSVAMPVYARGVVLEQAWTLGATGINEID